MWVKRHDSAKKLLDEATREVASESVADGVSKVFAEIVSEKFADVHNRGKVFSTEPSLSLSGVGAANIARITARRVRACAIVNIESVEIELL